MNVTRKTLGTRIFDFVVRPTFYRQFVGGDSECKKNPNSFIKSSNIYYFHNFLIIFSGTSSYS